MSRFYSSQLNSNNHLNSINHCRTLCQSVGFILLCLSAQAQVTPAAPVLPPAVSQDAPVASSQGELQLSVMVIDELTPRPVPLTDFQITSAADPTITQIQRTNLDGLLDVHLLPGFYTVASTKPLEFKGHLYQWKGTVTITADSITKVQWSDADAKSEAAKPARQISDEAVIYNMRKSGVVIVEGDRGRGSGFVVDPSGLILTNQHVVAGGRWVAVRFGPYLRVPAVVVEQDPAADVAVVCVNPSAFQDFTKDFPAIPLADPAQGPLAVEGEKVLAIGSPLSQENVLTIGIVSKVEKDYLVSDVNINHGSSGGPLLNLAGDAIGLTTFLDSAENGPGISGIVAITKAIPVLDRAKRKLSAGIQLPSADHLPTVSPVPIPDEALTAYSTKDSKPWSTGHPKNFQTVLVTPFYLQALQAEYEKFLSKDREDRIKKRGKQGDKDELQVSPSHSWERFALHTADSVVAVIVSPTLQTKSSSAWGSVFGAMAGINVPTKKEYRDDFYDMALYRGDTLVHPVRRQRDVVSALYADYVSSANDSALGGIYFYDPSVFAPGEDLKLYVRRESDLNRWDVVNIDDKEQGRIYQMFMPYRAALAQSGGDTSIQGLSLIIHSPPMAGAQWTPEAQEASQQVSADVTPLASPASIPLVSASHPSVVATSANKTAAVAVVSTSSALMPQDPATLTIKGLPCFVHVVTKNGESYSGTATSFDGKSYAVQTTMSLIHIDASDLKSVEYP